MEVHLNPRQIAFIEHRVSAGRFATAEEALEAAVCLLEESEASSATGADLVAAMQASPYKEIDLEPTRPNMPVRDFAV